MDNTIHTHLVRWVTWAHTHMSVLSPIFLYPFSHCWKMSSSHTFLVHILCNFLHAFPGSMVVLRVLGMILRNHTYLKVYKCWWILPILKIPTIKWFAIFFKKYFNFQGFYIIYIIIWWFLGWKIFTPSKLGETGLQKMQNGEFVLGEKHGKIAHWAKIRA